MVLKYLQVTSLGPYIRPLAPYSIQNFKNKQFQNFTNLISRKIKISNCILAINRLNVKLMLRYIKGL